jgi:pimeloyl-ACP methyl ester carboxylesterase
LSYGSFIGETYANMFPRRVRAMVLDGIVDPVPFTASTQAGIASSGADVSRVFAKRDDPQTAYAGARRVAGLLGNARLLTLNGYGHTTDVDPGVCIGHAVTAYLVRLATPPNGTVCQPDRQRFEPGFGDPPPAEPVSMIARLRSGCS